MVHRGQHLAQLLQFIDREFAEGGLDVVFLFDEGAEGVGVVDDGFASDAPVESITKRESATFHLRVFRRVFSAGRHRTGPPVVRTLLCF